MRAGAIQAVIGTAMLGIVVFAPAAAAAVGPPTDPSPVGGVGGGPYIGDTGKPAPPAAGSARAEIR
jgi:hypothetical protein